MSRLRFWLHMHGFHSLEWSITILTKYGVRMWLKYPW